MAEEVKSTEKVEENKVEENKVEEKKVEEVKPVKAAKDDKKDKKESKKDSVNVNTSNKEFAKPTINDFDVIIAPMMTEKTMSLIENQNKATFKVKKSANKTQIKNAFERIFKVKAVNVAVSNFDAKETTRGGRYKGKINGFKKAVVTIAEGQALDLFKEE